jgi:DNA-binding NtrC family response regulator
MTSKHERILIVDDEEAIRKLLHQKLSKEGYLCQEASNADEALSMIEDNPPALAILDIKMPGKLGTELLPEIKASYPDTAVIMASAVADTRTAVQCMKPLVSWVLASAASALSVMFWDTLAPF